MSYGSSVPPALQELVATVQRLQQRTTAPIVIAIDGRSGAGKSTVTAALSEALGATSVPCDDFFAAHISAGEWDARAPARRAADALDWRRLREEAIEPLRAGRPARWLPFDFAAGPRANGTYGYQTVPATREPRPVVLLDGAYSARPELVDVVDFAVLVEAPVAVRRARLAAREDSQFLAAWHACWDPAEEYYFTVVRPPATFDLVVTRERGC